MSLLRVALKSGISYVDTAASYGSAELALGLIAQELRAGGVRICTKVAVPTVVGDLPGLIEESRARLLTDVVDTVLLHSVQRDALESREVADECLRVLEGGSVRRLGASTYGCELASLALSASWCSALQFEYSILNPSVWPVARGGRRPGQELIARSVLCKGLLTTAWRDVPSLAAPLVSTLMALERRAAEWGMSLPTLAIRFALDTAGLDVVVVGVGTEAELADALAARDCPPLTATQLADLAEFDRSDVDAAHPERWTHV